MTRGPASLIERAFGRFIPEQSAGLDRQLRVYLGFVFVLFVPTSMVFGMVDWHRGDRLTGALALTISFVLISSLATLRHARDIRWGYRTVLGVAAVLLTVVVYVGGAGGYALLWYYAFPAGFYYVFGAREGSVWTAGLMAPATAIVLSDLGSAYPPELAGRFVVTYGLVAALALGLQRARDTAFGGLAGEKQRLEDALAQVRTLSEMLPMCAWCGKVRDDAGYWSRIEEYLRDRTGTQVSHGLCDECAARLVADGDVGSEGTASGSGPSR
ncbi:MAG: hypothetical protein AMXMBFR53_14050 [Gemmatimonadota bacterium]